MIRSRFQRPLNGATSQLKVLKTKALDHLVDYDVENLLYDKMYWVLVQRCGVKVAVEGNQSLASVFCILCS
jgi:hypothetical protein